MQSQSRFTGRTWRVSWSQRGGTFDHFMPRHDRAILIPAVETFMFIEVKASGREELSGHMWRRRFHTPHLTVLNKSPHLTLTLQTKTLLTFKICRSSKSCLCLSFFFFFYGRAWEQLRSKVWTGIETGGRAVSPPNVTTSDPRYVCGRTGGALSSYGGVHLGKWGCLLLLCGAERPFHQWARAFVRARETHSQRTPCTHPVCILHSLNVCPKYMWGEEKKKTWSDYVFSCAVASLRAHNHKISTKK